jgi:hypothetical protein
MDTIKMEVRKYKMADTKEKNKMKDGMNVEERENEVKGKREGRYERKPKRDKGREADERVEGNNRAR